MSVFIHYTHIIFLITRNFIFKKITQIQKQRMKQCLPWVGKSGREETDGSCCWKGTQQYVCRMDSTRVVTTRADLIRFGCLKGFVSSEDFSGFCGAMINMLVCLTIEITLLSLCISQCCIVDMNCRIYNLYFYINSNCAT